MYLITDCHRILLKAENPTSLDTTVKSTQHPFHPRLDFLVDALVRSMLVDMNGSSCTTL